MKWAYVLAVASASVACGGGASPETAPAAETAAAAAPAPAPAAAEAPAVAEASRPAVEAAARPAVPRASAVHQQAAERDDAVRDITVPVGTTLTLALSTAVASDTGKVEEEVRATLDEDVRVDGRTALPAGSELVGTVTDVDRSGRVKGRARVTYEFTSVRVGHQHYTVSTTPVAHEAESTKGEDAAKIGIGAGAVIGGLLGGGDGAAKGAAIGGGAGTGVVLATRGREVRLEPGTNVRTSLRAPLTVRVRK